MLCPMIIFHIVKVMRGADFGSGRRSRTEGDGGSVARSQLAHNIRPWVSKHTKRKRSKGIHNQVDPQKLNCCQH